MATNPETRILAIGQDNLFADVPGCAVDYLPTAETITPCLAPARLRLRRLPRVVAKVCAGQYDLVALPAVDFRWSHDLRRTKRILRRIIAAAGQSRLMTGPLNRLLARRQTRVIVLDRYDSHEVAAEFLRCVTSAAVCFKTNLRAEDQGRLCPLGPGRSCRLKPLPYWLAVENYPTTEAAAKDIDVCFAGTANSPQRRFSIDALRPLADEGYRIQITEGRLPMAEYVAQMSRSWLTLSPEGHGYNGFRHYEAMLAGSVPLVNRAQPPIVTDLVDGRNCLLYDLTRDGLLQVVRAALANKAWLQTICRPLRAFVVERHSLRAVGAYLLAETFAAD